jgi:ATP-binding cassette subfamily B protein/subfamily B ATP-binding cassette protein MsbA
VKDLLRLWPYFRPYWRLAVVTGLAVLLSASLALLTPWPLKVLIDSVLGNKPVPAVFAWAGGNGSTSLLIWVAASGLLIVLVDGASNVFDSYLATKLDQRMTLDFRGDLLRHTERLSLAFHDQKRSGMLVYAINFMASAAADIVMALPPLIQSGLTLIGMVVITLRWTGSCRSCPDRGAVPVRVGPAVRPALQPRLYRVQERRGRAWRSSTRRSRC